MLFFLTFYLKDPEKKYISVFAQKHEATQLF